MDYQQYTDDAIAIIVVGSTFAGYFIGNMSIPTEPMMLVLGYFFGKRVAAQKRGE